MYLSVMKQTNTPLAPALAIIADAVAKLQTLEANLEEVIWSDDTDICDAHVALKQRNAIKRSELIESLQELVAKHEASDFLHL